jgi:hypothetical protein
MGPGVRRATRKGWGALLAAPEVPAALESLPGVPQARSAAAKRMWIAVENRVCCRVILAVTECQNGGYGRVDNSDG